MNNSRKVRLIKRKNGFTSVELLLVVAIILVINAVAFPKYIGLLDSAKDKIIEYNTSTLADSVYYYAVHYNQSL